MNRVSLFPGQHAFALAKLSSGTMAASCLSHCLMHEIFGLLTRCRDCGRVFRVNAAVSSPKRAANVRLTFCCWLGTGKKESAVDKGKEIPAPGYDSSYQPKEATGKN